MYERLRRRMVELADDCLFIGGDATTSCGSVSSTGFWDVHRDGVSYNQLQKFWSELPLHARQELLRIDKQTLFKHTRKNMYCSRCNGLLLEGFMQIVMYGKSLQQDGVFGHGSGNRLVCSMSQTVENVCLTTGCNDDVQDPSVHPWGCLTTTRDGTLTVLDCYINSKHLKGLQNVFDNARARERERELLYPDACGGGGRGWISQGMVGYGRGHGTRETCALHTARLSVDTLVDFWSALREETRYSLLRMKEEDFMQRLMCRFDSKRFCRDCRKNVIREFKELKELKRMRREAHCTNWFCAADASFQYKVTLDTIQADWHQNYADSAGTYSHYEWAVGTGKGKSDILDFENVGSNSSVQVNGLDLTGLNSCFITLRAWRTDGRCNEISVKAHALNGQHCVHGRLVVGDGFVTITRGESIRRFFEHAEEAEEEELDDDSVDKDGNELVGECSRPQKHAKSPELARECLLDAATVIFKEQVEKAFREGTARQNAHSMFVSLALKLLEERLLVACKDIITLEKQCKLLEEEEKEKREEEERKERRRVKEKEKKLRRKERLRIKEKEKEKNCGQLSQTSTILDSKEESTSVSDDLKVNDNTYCEEQEENISSKPASDDFTQENQISDHDRNSNGEFCYEKEENQLFVDAHSNHNRRRLKSRKDYPLDQPSKWSGRRRFENGPTVNKLVPRFHSDDFETSSRNRNSNGVNKPIRRSNGSRYNERSQCSHNRTSSRFDQPTCYCYQHNNYQPESGKPEPDMDVSKPYIRGNKYNNQNEDVSERAKTKTITGSESGYTKRVWEPRTNLDPDGVTDRSADIIEPIKLTSSANGTHSIPISSEDDDLKESKGNVHIEPEPEPESEITDLFTSSSNSNSDSCSSCPSEDDGNTSFSSNPQNSGSSSISDSEYSSQHSEVIKDASLCLENSVELSSKTSESVTGSCSQGNNNIIPPPLQAQSIHFPVFQAPSMGHYHKGPVLWTPSSPNGLPHSTHNLIASPFGYSINGSPCYLQYGVGGLQPLGPPLVNHDHPPMCQQVSPVNNTVKHQTKAIPIKNKPNENSDKPQKGNTGFSLFHFGGPVDVSNGLNSDAAAGPLKEEIDADVCSKTSVWGDSCGVEEYNLFAANSGLKFSFF